MGFPLIYIPRKANVRHVAIKNVVKNIFTLTVFSSNYLIHFLLILNISAVIRTTLISQKHIKRIKIVERN